MKKMIALLLVMLLPVCAVAETLQERLGAPTYIETTSQNNTGKTVVNFSADVIVPDAAQVNIYEVRARLFSAEEIERAGAVLFAGREYSVTTDFRTMPLTIVTGETTTQYYAGGSTLHMVEGEVFPVPESEFSVVQRVMKNGMMSRSELEYEGVNDASAGDIITYNAAASNPHIGDTAQGCCLPLTEAKAQADHIARQLAPSMIYAGQGIVPGFQVNGGASTALEAYMKGDTSTALEAYIFYYAPAYELPWNYANYMLQYDYAIPSAEESLCIIVSDERIEYACWTAPHEIVGVIDADVELLPFDQIMEVADHLLPLSLTYLEGRSLTLRCDITQIRLGYMRVQCINDPTKLQLVPVWDFYGTLHRFKDGEPHHTDNTACKSWLTINAIDGTVIDRMYGY